MRLTLKTIITTSVLAPFPASAVIIDFENTPSLPQGPSTFLMAGPTQTLTVGDTTISGGVVLGDPTFTPASPFGTPPNFYGTASEDLALADPSLQTNISLDFADGSNITTVEGLLFNGNIIPETYTVTAFSNSTVVDSVTLANLPGNLQQGLDEFRLNSNGAPLDQVLFEPDLSDNPRGEWDYVIDTIAINEPIENVTNVTDVPSPGTLLLLATGLVGMTRLRRYS